jgi:hypothetical protein
MERDRGAQRANSFNHCCYARARACVGPGGFLVPEGQNRGDPTEGLLRPKYDVSRRFCFPRIFARFADTLLSKPKARSDPGETWKVLSPVVLFAER